MSVLYPLFLKLEGRAVLVVGAGAVAERKIGSLLEAGAKVRVVAPDATTAVKEWATRATLTWIPRRFEDEDLRGAWFVVAATSDPDVQRRIAAVAEEARVFVLAVDDPDNASAYSGAIVRRPPFLVAISSSGATPALTRLVREVVERMLPSERWVEHARAMRARWQAEGTPTADRFADLVRELRDLPPSGSDGRGGD